MKRLKLDEFVRQYRMAPNLAETGEGIAAAFGYMSFVYKKKHDPLHDGRHTVDLVTKDIERIVRALEAEISRVKAGT